MFLMCVALYLWQAVLKRDVDAAIKHPAIVPVLRVIRLTVIESVKVIGKEMAPDGAAKVKVSVFITLPKNVT